MKHATKLENGLAKNREYEIKLKIIPYNAEYCGAKCPQQLAAHFGQVFYCRLFSESFVKRDSLKYDENCCVKRHPKCIVATKNA